MGKDSADEKREWGAFDPGNVGAYPGRVIRVRPGMLQENILDIRGTDDRGVQLTTIILGSKPCRPEFDTFRAAFAHLEFGVAGGRDDVWVDWLQGQCITVAGTFFRVNAYYPIGNVNPPLWPPVIPEPETFGEPADPFAEPVLNDDQALFLSANVAPQPHPQAAYGATPRLTIYVTIAPGTVQAPTPSAFIRVPPHAQSVTVLSNSAVFEPSLVSFHSIQSVVASLYSESPQSNFDVEAIPIGRGVEWIVLWNEDESERLCQLLFTIGL